MKEDALQIGTRIPPGASFPVRIYSPAYSDLAEFRGQLRAGEPTTVRMEYTGNFHTFVFEDENGPIAKDELLRDIEVIIYKPGERNDVWLRYRDFKDGGKFPLGLYKPRTGRYEFEPIQVTHESPEKLVFKLPAPKRYYGRVLNGVTGEPMPGATVKLSYAKPVKTDDEGLFDITMPVKSMVYSIVIKADGYLKVRIPKGWADKDENGNRHVPDVKLFPSATVTVEPISKQQRPSRRSVDFRPQWAPVGRSNPAWADELIAACGKHPQDGIYRNATLETGKRGTFEVPAGVNLRMQLRALDGIEWAPLTNADDIRLEAGQVFDANRPQFTDPFNVFVEVLDPRGQPVEGVPVIANGHHDPAVSSSDREGIAIHEFVGYSKGDFIIECKSEDPKTPAERQTMPYEIAGPEDANSMFTIEVSDQLLERLFE
jgi:hypothetical protein